MTEQTSMFAPKTYSFTIGDQDLFLAPMKVREFKAMVVRIQDVLESFKQFTAESKVSDLVSILLEKAVDVMMLVFPTTKYPFMSREFIEENLDMHQVKVILEKVVEVNELDKIFPFLKGPFDGKTEAPPSPAKT